MESMKNKERLNIVYHYLSFQISSSSMYHIACHLHACMACYFDTEKTANSTPILMSVDSILVLQAILATSCMI